MTTEPKPCTVKGCKSIEIHHHDPDTLTLKTGCGLNVGGYCAAVTGMWMHWSEPFAPRVAKSTRIAALTAENAALIEQGWADAKVVASLTAKLAARPTVSLEPFPSVRGAVANSQTDFRNRARAALAAAREAGAL